jgi:hypothetical protein
VASGLVAMGILVFVVGQDSDLVKLVSAGVALATSLLTLGGKWLAKAQQPQKDDFEAKA